MCAIDDTDEIIAAAQLLKDARTHRTVWLEADEYSLELVITVTKSEGLRLIDQRITDAEERLRLAGFTGRVKRVSEGDNQLVMASR